MSTRIVTNGQDPLTTPVLDYLIESYGIDPAHIRRLQLDSPAGAPQTITVTLEVHHDEPLAAAAVLEQDTVMVPLIKARMRDEQPRSQCADQDCPMPEHRISHAPTTCVYLVPTEIPLNQRHPCGELIQWHQEHVDVTWRPDDPVRHMAPGMGYWVHASDGRLGTSTHPATPGA
jgi:hypothetical protein